MAEEATAPAATETPATPVETVAPAPANDTAKTPDTPANDNGQPPMPTEAEVLALAERYGVDKALEILARKRGYTIDGAEMTVAERAAFREEKRKWKEHTTAREQAIEAAISEKVKQHEGDIEYGKALRAAFEAGDYDALARKLGKDGWNALQDDFIARLADPNHKRLVELERREQEREAAQRQAQEQHERQQTQAQREANIRAYKTKMSSDMKESQNTTLRELSDFPDVINMLYAVQNHHYDRANDRTITLEDALKKPLPGGTVAVEQILRQWQEGLSKAFRTGETAPTLAATAETPKAKGSTEPAPKVAPSPTRALDDDDWVKAGAKRLEEAIRAEELARLEAKRKGNSQAST